MAHWLRLLAAGFGAAAASAAEPSPAAALPPIFAPKAPAAERPKPGAWANRLPPTRRAASPELAEKMSSLAVRAAPAATEPAKETPRPAPPADEAGITKLDPFYVQEDKAVKLKERDSLSAQGRLEKANQLNPGLRPGGLPLLNTAVGQEMLAEEEAKERRREESELRSLMGTGKAGIPPSLRRTLDAGSARNNDWAGQGGMRFKPLQ